MRGRDSEQVRLARGLLSDSETKVIFRQAPAELALVRDLCRLNERETAIVASLPNGSALWEVGSRSFQVETVLGAWEREITRSRTSGWWWSRRVDPRVVPGGIVHTQPKTRRRRRRHRHRLDTGACATAVQNVAGRFHRETAGDRGQ